MSSRVSLVAGCLVALACCQLVVAAPTAANDTSRFNIDGLVGSDYFLKAYIELNKQLEKSTTSNDLDLNIEVAADLYDHPEKSDLGSDELFRGSLRLFQALSTLTLENQCSLYSARVLKNNYDAAFGLPWWGYSDSLLYTERRVNKIVARLCNQHAIDCAEKYFGKYLKAYEQVDKDEKKKSSLEVVEQLTLNLVKQEKGEDGKGIWYDAKALFDFSKSKNFQFFQIINRPKYAIENLQQLAKNDPDLYLSPITTPPHVYKEKIEALVDRYMIQPCTLHNSIFEEVFKPAELDAMFQVEINTIRIDYYQTWAKYRYCDSLISGSYELSKNIVMLKDVIKQ